MDSDVAECGSAGPVSRSRPLKQLMATSRQSVLQLGRIKLGLEAQADA